MSVNDKHEFNFQVKVLNVVCDGITEGIYEILRYSDSLSILTYPTSIICNKLIINIIISK